MGSKQRNYNLPVKNARIVIIIEENKQIIFEEIALDSNGNDDKNAGYNRVTGLGTVRGLIEERTVTVFPNTNVYYPNGGVIFENVTFDFVPTGSMASVYIKYFSPME